MIFLCRMDVQDFEILSDVIKGPMHEKPQRVSSVMRADVSSPDFQGVRILDTNFCHNRKKQHLLTSHFTLT